MKKIATVLSAVLYILLTGSAFGGQVVTLGNSGSGATLLSQDQTGLMMRIDIDLLKLGFGDS